MNLMSVLRRAAIAAVTVIPIVALVPAAASAAPAKRPLVPAAQPAASAVAPASCTGNCLNGKDPQTSGCSANATTLSSAPMITASGYTIGSIEMRYSYSCGTQWIRVNDNYTNCSGDPCRNEASITRPSGQDGGRITYTDDGRPADGQPSQWSRMVYTPNTRSCGTGYVDDGLAVGWPNGTPHATVCG